MGAENAPFRRAWQADRMGPTFRALSVVAGLSAVVAAIWDVPSGPVLLLLGVALLCVGCGAYFDNADARTRANSYWNR